MPYRFVRHRLLILFLIVVLAAAALMPALVGAQVPTIDYDTDNDRFIEISNLAQFNAVRWDLNGDGAVSDDSATADVDEATDYAAVFPTPATGMGCPSDSRGCEGYELEVDLDFDTNGSGDADSGDTYWNDGAGWTPIAPFAEFSDPSYESQLYGNGHSISNLYSTTGGLFGWTGSESVFENLALLNVNIHGTGSVGALVDVSGADIAGVYVQGVVSATATATATAGMIVGYNGGWIRGSYVAGSVSGTSNVGGLVGYFEVGEIVASYSTASVSAAGASGSWRLGGLVGVQASGATVTNSYWDKDTSGLGAQLNGGTGPVTDIGVVKSSAELQLPTGYSGIYADWDDLDADGTADTDTLWQFGANSQYPYLHWQATAPPAQPLKNDYDLDNDGLIEIDSLHQLHAIRWDLDGNGQVDDVDDIGGFYMVFPDPQGDLGCDVVACAGYELTTDLDFDSDNDGSVTASDDFFANFPWADSGAAAFTTTIANVFEGDGWVPIGYSLRGYGGVLDGGGHVIRNLYIDAEAQYMGLFGSLKAGAVVRNLGLLEADLDNTRANSAWTSGLVGQNSGDIIAVSFDGSVNSVNTSGVTGAGGVAGENVGRIIASYSTGDIATTDGPIGGLAGQNDTQVIASYSTASVTATPADATKSHPGGLIGLADTGSGKTPTATNSYFDTGASGQTTSAGGDGKTARELQTPTGYAGWDDIDMDGDPATVDENDFWRFGLPGQYPVLWWEAAEVEAGTTDYDSDNDGLIEVGSLAQLDAMRWDLNGDGAADTNDGVVPHGAAYPPSRAWAAPTPALSLAVRATS